MSKILRDRLFAAVVLALFLSAPISAQPNLTSSGYKENFDSMGVDGASPPDGWTMYTIPGSNTTWQPPTGVPADQMSPELYGRPSGGLTPVLFPSNPPAPTNNNGWNAANADTPTDRALAGGPTGVAGAVLELVLTNATGGPVTSLSVSFDIRRFQVGAGGADELPGFWIFYSLDGGVTYTNVSQLNSDSTSVPNTVGVTHMAGQFNLSAALANGDSINLCWVDDNGIASSPDEIIGLDNVSITASAAAVTQQSIGIRFFGSGGPGNPVAMAAAEIAGAVPQANWNQEQGATNFNVGPLNDNNGVSLTGTLLSYTCANTWTTGITDAPGDARLMSSYLDSNTNDYNVVIIEGLSHLTTSNGMYDVYLYFNGDTHNGRHGFYSVGGSSGFVTKEGTDLAAFNPATGYMEDKQDGNGGNYLHFANVSGDTLFILANAQNPNDPTDNGFRAPLNAIQIVAD